jgi:hypothetical protein
MTMPHGLRKRRYPGGAAATATPSLEAMLISGEVYPRGDGDKPPRGVSDLPTALSYLIVLGEHQ